MEKTMKDFKEGGYATVIVEKESDGEWDMLGQTFQILKIGQGFKEMALWYDKHKAIRVARCRPSTHEEIEKLKSKELREGKE